MMSICKQLILDNACWNKWEARLGNNTLFLSNVANTFKNPSSSDATNANKSYAFFVFRHIQIIVIKFKNSQKVKLFMIAII